MNKDSKLLILIIYILSILIRGGLIGLFTIWILNILHIDYALKDSYSIIKIGILIDVIYSILTIKESNIGGGSNWN